MKRVLLFALLAVLCSLPLTAEPHYPNPQGYVTDAAGIIDAPTRSQIENQLSNLEHQTSVEIAVATVPSLEGETVETYAVELFKKWGIGKKGRDNGVLILVAAQDRKVRIEVGYGLEPVLTDGTCGQIIRDYVVPEFRAHRYGAGIKGGVDAVISVLTRQPLARKPFDTSGFLMAGGAKAAFVLFAILLVILPATAIGAALCITIFVFAGSPLGFLGIIIVLFGLWFDVRQYRKSGGRGSGIWGTPGFSSGSYGGFGGGGGSFGGFGGGSSGGGGASGGW